MKKHLIKIIAALLISVVVYGLFYLVFSFSGDDAFIQAITAFITLLSLEFLMPLIIKTSKLFPGDSKGFRPIKLGWGKKLKLNRTNKISKNV